MSTNRETTRDALAALLQTALVGTGLPAGAVYAYQVGKFDATPAIVVYSAGSERSDLTSIGGQATFRFIIDVFVAYTDAGNWNEDDAEDRIDLLEKSIWDTLQANQVTANWQSLDYAEQTKVETIIVDGQAFRTERIPVAVTVFN